MNCPYGSSSKTASIGRHLPVMAAVMVARPRPSVSCFLAYCLTILRSSHPLPSSDGCRCGVTRSFLSYCPLSAPVTLRLRLSAVVGRSHSSLTGNPSNEEAAIAVSRSIKQVPRHPIRGGIPAPDAVGGEFTKKEEEMLPGRLIHSHGDCRPARVWNPSILGGVRVCVLQEGQRLPFQGSRNCYREVLRPASHPIWGRVELDIFKEGNETAPRDEKELPRCSPSNQPMEGGVMHFKEVRSPTPKEREETEGVDQPGRGVEFIKKGRKPISSAIGQAMGRNQLSSRRSAIQPEGWGDGHHQEGMETGRESKRTS